MPATFAKRERVCSLKEIEAIVHGGKSLFHYPFRVSYKIDLAAEDDFPAAIIVSVPKRNFKRAVKRNLLKRRIRESYRLNKQLLEVPEGKRISLMFVYVSKEIIPSASIEPKLKEVLLKLNTGVEWV